MSKSVKFFLALATLLIFNFSAAAYSLQFSDTAKTNRLHWRKGKIQIALSTSMTAQNSGILPQNDVEDAVRRSLKTWEAVANVKFELVLTDKQTVSPSGNIGDGVSLITVAPTAENLVLFGNTIDEISAQTRTFYNKQGIISEADIVLNPYQQFSTDGTVGTYDLESTLTHEIGHLLGLDHSFVLGATMSERQGKNGIYNLQSFSSRTLSEDDITGIRAVYGSNEQENGCCGTVAGKINQSKNRSAGKFRIWAEDENSGRVIGGVSTNADGGFRFDGLAQGNYHFYLQDDGKSEFSASEELGSYEIVKGKTINILKNVRNGEKKIGIQYVGLNGQVSDLSVSINSGKSYTLYVGGKNLDVDNVKIGFDSPYLTVTPGSITKHDYGADISVISFEVRADAGIPLGEYSPFIKFPNGVKQYLIGGITVENFLNAWNTYVLPFNLKD